MRTADELRAKREELLNTIAREKVLCRTRIMGLLRAHMDDRVEDFFRSPCDREFIQHAFHITGGASTDYPQLDKDIVYDAFNAVSPEWREKGFNPELLDNYDSDSRANRVGFSIRLKFEAKPRAATPVEDDVPF